MEINKKIFTKSFCFKLCIGIFLAAAMIGTMILLLPSKTDQERLAHDLETGSRYLEELNYERAVAAYTNALKIDPKNVDAVCGLAEAYLGLGDTETAKEALHKFLDRIAKNPYRSKQEAVYVLLAKLYYEEGDLESVVDVIRHAAIRLDSDKDNVPDFHEHFVYLDPENSDTDGDGISDGEVVFRQMVSVPTEKFSDGVCPVLWNNDRKKYYMLNEAVSLKSNTTLSGIGSKVGDPYECNIDKAKDVRLGFLIPAEAMKSYYALEEFCIASYDYSDNRLIFHPTEASYQEDGAVLVLSDQNESGTYLLINEKRFRNDIDIAEESELVALGKADVVFVLDTTGSMASPISNVEHNIAAFTEYLASLGVDIRIGLVYYKDIYEDGPASTQDMGFYYDFEEFLEVLKGVAYQVEGGGDNPETCVDALDVMRHMSFRAGVSKFAVVLTDAESKNGIQADVSYTLEQVTQDLADAGIRASVVTGMENYEGYRELASKTGGELCDIYDSDFMSVLKPLMNKIGTSVQDGCWVRLANGCVVHLTEDPALGGFADTDGDGISDREELKELVSVPYQDASGNAGTYFVYTFTSNPALADSDGDGYMDAVDKAPLKSDCVTSALMVKDGYLMVASENGVTYGVSRLNSQDGNKLSTALVALENSLLYLQQSMGLRYLTPADMDGDVCKTEEVYVLTNQILSEYAMEEENNTAEALSKMKKLKEIFEAVRKERESATDTYVSAFGMNQILHHMVSRYKDCSGYYMPLDLFEEEEIVWQIVSSLDANLPILLQNGAAARLPLYDTTDFTVASTFMGGSEWAVITGYIKDDIKKFTVIRLVYDGKIYYADFAQVMRQRFMGAVVGIR